MLFHSVSDTTSKLHEKPVLLVVDDEEGPRASLKVVFKNDFEVLIASNGRDALELARKHHIDVAILDILMHGMSGVDVLRELKHLDEGIEVIMLTAYETLETARQALRFGAREYLNKPFDIPTLRAVASRALEKRRATSDLQTAHLRLAELQGELMNSALRGDAAASVVHDLNNPLTVISGFVELLHRQVQSVATLQGEELDSMRDGISSVRSQVQRCIEISRRYLTSTRASVPSDERTPVNQVLVDLNELLQKHPSAKGNTLIIHEMPGLPVVTMHGTDLLRVLLNLATNALQAGSRPHRVEVTGKLLHSAAELPDRREGEFQRFVASEEFGQGGMFVAITVRDTGEGMPADMVRRVFNETFTTKPADQGHGVGLRSVKGLVLGAKGAVRLETAVGQGSTFTVYLPARD